MGWHNIVYSVLRTTEYVSKSIYKHTMDNRFENMNTEDQDYLEEAFKEAAGNGNMEYLMECIGQGIPIDIRDKYHFMTALSYACQNGHLDIAHYLTHVCNATVTTDEVADACCAGHLEIVKCLTKESHDMIDGKDESIDGWTPLHNASTRGHYEIVQYLTKICHANVDITTNCGETALYLATIDGLANELGYFYTEHNGYLDIVQYLVNECNANVNVQNKNEHTALHGACFNNRLDIVKCLTNKFTANVNLQAKDGCTPVHYALYKGNYDIVEYLTKVCYANIEIKNNRGQTALHLAIRNGFLKVVQYSIEVCDADLFDTTNDGENVFDFANESKHRNDMVVYLLQCFQSKKS
jgi:ankyrin repeat protein